MSKSVRSPSAVSILHRVMLLVSSIVSLSIFSLVYASTPVSEPVEIDSALLEQVLNDMVKKERMVGGALLVNTKNTNVFYKHAGLSDRESERAWQRDTLVNIYSMTKPITGVALMTLYEKGLFKLDDPIHKYLPEFANQKVYVGRNDNGRLDLEPVNRPVTVRDLMRHTSGMGYGWEDNPVALRMSQINPFDPSKTISQFSQEMATLPLQFQPGTQWQYSVSVDIQARLVEVLANTSFDAYLKTTLFEPLRMFNTSYFVENEKKSSVSAIYIKQRDGSFVREPNALVYGFYPTPPVQKNGGHGLISTIDDYMKFALMLQNEGEYEGQRILKASTVKLMASDQLPADLQEKSWLVDKGQMGFGLDFAVRIAMPKDTDEAFGFTGEFYWDGRASTLFWVDPVNDVTVVFFTQVIPFDFSLHKDIRKAVYQALGLYSV